MFQLDDAFLQDIGMADLPDDQKEAFLQHIYATLEERVGVKLSDGLSDEQLEEFEKIIDKDDATVGAWLSTHVPAYQTDEIFIRMQEVTKLPANDPGLIAEFASTKWLELNRPDYRVVVAAVLDELKKEIIGNTDKLLDSNQAA
ncbi:MAG: DUF5663 domain-containing protein [Candidatus Saccharimonadales bacterium]